jgi:hypothetical protein
MMIPRMNSLRQIDSRGTDRISLMALMSDYAP